MQVRWPPSLTPVTYLSKLLGIHSVAAFLHHEIYRVRNKVVGGGCAVRIKALIGVNRACQSYVPLPRLKAATWPAPAHYGAPLE
ncbi:hypothetical protein BS639_03260 [Rouxiella silvae]|uniref:Uncharacterized protein n=1 Tax=Rouxiella silvae TaxID=1646373 RepID=A0ABX3U580_9GAMM|nr:hypothetical protein BS639_03260 [Rouxiella silvae]